MDQTRGMKILRREGKKAKTVESKAAATGAKIALITGLFKLCWFIFKRCFCFLK
jgi:hypothetical protein